MLNNFTRMGDPLTPTHFLSPQWFLIHATISLFHSVHNTASLRKKHLRKNTKQHPERSQFCAAVLKTGFGLVPTAVKKKKKAVIKVSKVAAAHTLDTLKSSQSVKLWHSCIRENSVAITPQVPFNIYRFFSRCPQRRADWAIRWRQS